ncbi:MAG: GHKL domain-containing protein [bacterium]|nr:GHKL domain-containing protein [bacterium]
MSLVKKMFYSKTSVPVFYLILLGLMLLVPFVFVVFSPEFILPQIIVGYKHYLASMLQLRGYLVHIMLEWLCAWVAIITSILTIVHYSIKRQISTPIIGIALFFAGALDLFAILATTQVLFQVKDIVNFVPFIWTINRLFFIILLTTEVIILTFRKRIKKDKDLVEKHMKNDIVLIVITNLILLVVAYFFIRLAGSSPALPVSYFLNNLSIDFKMYDLITLFFFVITGLLVFPYHYFSFPSVFSNSLMLCIIPSIIGQVIVSFYSKDIFDAGSNSGSFFKLMSYGTIFLGLGLDYINTYQKELRSQHRLRFSLRKLFLRKKELEKVNLELDSFVYTASHDLKTPLRGIASFADILQEDYADTLDAEGKSYLKRISTSIIRMQNLINDLLTLSRISRVKKKYSKVDLQSLVAKIVTHNEQYLEKKVEFEIYENMPVIYAEEIKMETLISNLITNAIKFSQKNTKVVPRIEIGFKIETNRCVVFVKDNGIGIEEQYHGKIFEMFKRLHTNHDYEGSGLGLSIVKRIAEDHSGECWVESAKGQGATFFFSIPKYQGYLKNSDNISSKKQKI